MMTFDCILLVDGHLSRAAERRLYALIDAHAEGGIGTGIILTSRSPGGSSWFRSAPAQRRLREGGVVWLDPALPQRAELALVLSPSLAGFGRNRPLRLEAAKALVWPIEADMGEGDDPSELRRLAARLQTILDCAVAWAARSDLERRDLARHLTGMTLDPDIWWPPLSPSPVPPQKRPASLETVGRHFGQGFKLDDTGAGEWSEAWRERWPATLVVLGETDLVSGLPMCAPDQDMRIEQGSERRLGAFLDGLDLFVAAGENAGSGRLEEEILEAMAAGVPVIATPRIAERFEGRLPAAEACFLADLALRIASDREGLDAVRKDQAALLEKRHGPGTHVARLRSCLGAKAGEGNRVEIPFVRAGAVRRPGRLLFIADDSPYLEHLPRQLAIARHLQAPLEPYFLTMARDAPLAERLGFSLEYLLPHSSRVYRSLFEEADGWNESLAGHLQELICFLDAKAVVFDGVYPFAGLAEVCTRYPNLPFIWIRRSLWRADAEEGGLNRSGLFDLIVEPGERAEAFDRGPTRKHRERVVATAPVLFGPRCGADRARFELGLEGGRPAVLLRPTIPSDQRTGQAMQELLRTLAGGGCRFFTTDLVPDAAAESWPVEAARLDTLAARRQLAAFDLVISGADYQSVHESAASGTPSVFLPDPAKPTDDQVTRAALAARQGWAIVLARGDVYGARAAARRVLDPEERRAMAGLCSADETDGAEQAALAIGQAIYALDMSPPSTWRKEGASGI